MAEYKGCSVYRILLILLASGAALCSACHRQGSAEHSGATQSDVGWSAYGSDDLGTRYSPLTEIATDNVSKLRVAWTFRTGELGSGVRDWARSAFEATPILFEKTLYFTTPATNVVAVDATTGTLRWRYDTHTRKDVEYSDGVSRGVSLWVDDATAASAVCHARIYAPTLDSRLLALDAATGQPCQDFGTQGAIDLKVAITLADSPAVTGWWNYLVTSPPAILDGKVIVGSSIGDNRAAQLERGTVRAFDARTGRLIWSWDPIPRDPSNPVYTQWSAEGAKTTGAANAWAPLSVDRERHLVFVPTGSASPDYFGVYDLATTAGPIRLWHSTVPQAS
jgi:quinoprotein glucose dehydrogenase